MQDRKMSPRHTHSQLVRDLTKIHNDDRDTSSLVRRAQGTLKTIWVVMIALGCLPEHEGKSLLEGPYICVTGIGEIKLDLTSLRDGSHSLGRVMRAAKERKSTNNPMQL